MKKLILMLIACLALGVVVAGCGSDDDDGGGGSDSGGAAAPAETSGGGATTEKSGGTSAKAAEVDMKDITFTPETITVDAGATVTWKNEDSVGHDVTADDDSFSSGDPGGISGGGEFKHTFAKAGDFKYVCTVHPGMEGEVVVK
jgi:plastocyanin